MNDTVTDTSTPTTKRAGCEALSIAARDLAEAGLVSNGVATAIEQLLKLEGHEAMLACRLLGGGADPASLDYLRTGGVDPMIELAHRAGPAVFPLDHPGRENYLVLVESSEDEAQDSTLRSRVLQFSDALEDLERMDEAPDPSAEAASRAASVEREITSLKFATLKLGASCPPVRLYASDLGHAAGAWDEDDPQTATAVFGIFNGEPYVGLGAPPYCDDLEAQGFDPQVASKRHAPRFWIIEDELVVQIAQSLLVEAGLLEETR